MGLDQKLILLQQKQTNRPAGHLQGAPKKPVISRVMGGYGQKPL